jgi:hypothetical protein
MRTKTIRMVGVLMLWVVILSLACGEKADDRQAEEQSETPAYTAADSLNWGVFVAYLQDHFDDFHDVTMRYHHRDPTINGIVTLRMTWENGRLVSADVVSNETGSDDLPEALIEKMKGWEIKDLTGPAEITLPVNVKLVGSDDPNFPNTAILTGEVKDTEGNPLKGVMVIIKPQVAGQVYRAETNSEGIFVRTLIPPGTWDLDYMLEGYDTAVKPGVTLSAGQHMREQVVLDKK